MNLMRNQFQTSVRGLKVRGSYPTQQEAELDVKCYVKLTLIMMYL